MNMLMWIKSKLVYSCHVLSIIFFAVFFFSPLDKLNTSYAILSLHFHSLIDFIRIFIKQSLQVLTNNSFFLSSLSLHLGIWVHSFSLCRCVEQGRLSHKSTSVLHIHSSIYKSSIETLLQTCQRLPTIHHK